MKVNEKLKLFRTLKGMNQSQIAEMARISQGAISQFEKSEIRIKNSSLVAISRSLGIKEEFLLHDKLPIFSSNIYFADLSPVGMGRIHNSEIDATIKTLFPSFLHEFCNYNCIVLTAKSSETNIPYNIYVLKSHNQFLCIKIIGNLNYSMNSVLISFQKKDKTIPIDVFKKIERDYFHEGNLDVLKEIVGKLEFVKVVKAENQERITNKDEVNDIIDLLSKTENNKRMTFVKEIIKLPDSDLDKIIEYLHFIKTKS